MYSPENASKNKRGWSLLPGIIIFGLASGLLLAILFGFFTVDRPDNRRNQPAEELSTESSGTRIAYSKLVISGQTKNADEPGQTKQDAAPGFLLPDLFDDSLQRSLADYSGRPLILNFWASWCVPCREEMPLLQRSYVEHYESGLVVIGLNQTFADSLDAAREFVRDLELTFPNVQDESGTTSKQRYRVIGLPTSVFVTREGKIAHTHIGQLTDEQIATFSRLLIDGEPIPR